MYLTSRWPAGASTPVGAPTPRRLTSASQMNFYHTRGQGSIEFRAQV